MYTYKLSVAVALAVVGCESRERLDCTLGDPEVVCQQPSTCNTNTQRCQSTCKSSGDCETGQECHGRWCVKCAPIGEKPKPGEDTCYCRRHSDCTSNFCDVYQTDNLGQPGVCIPASIAGNSGNSVQNVLYVDKDGCLSLGTADGTAGRPYCEINQAVARNVLEQSAHPIRVLPSGRVYGGGFVQPGLPSSLMIVGPDVLGDGASAVVEAPIMIDGTTFDRSVDITLDSIRIRNDIAGSEGVSCLGKSHTHVLRLHRVSISPIDLSKIPGIALKVSGCILEMDRSSIMANRNNAILLKPNLPAETSYQITNSVIANNVPDSKNPRAIELTISPVPDDLSEYNKMGVFRFNTVYGNINNSAGVSPDYGLYCGMGTMSSPPMYDSIVLQNQQRDSKQIAQQCILDTSVIQAGSVMFDVIVPYDSRNPENFALSKDDIKAHAHAAARASDLMPMSKPLKIPERPILFPYYYRWDFLGRSRPAGETAKTKADIGAFQVK